MSHYNQTSILCKQIIKALENHQEIFNKGDRTGFIIEQLVLSMDYVTLQLQTLQGAHISIMGKQ